MDPEGVAGLPGPAELRRELRRALAAGRSPALFLIRVVGHDRLLETCPESTDRAVAEAVSRLDRLVRAGDSVGMMAADTIAVVANGLRRASAVGLAERIEGAMVLPVEFDGSTVALQVRIGVGLAEDGGYVERIMERAMADMDGEQG